MKNHETVLDPTIRVTFGSGSFGPVLLSGVSISVLWAYLLIVGALGETPFGISMSLGRVATAVAGGFVAFVSIISWLQRRQLVTPAFLMNASLAVGCIVPAVIALDVAYSGYLNLNREESDNDRFADANLWIGELYPDLYYPSEKNFRVHKPGRTITGDHFGDMYVPAMLRSPVLTGSVLSRKHVTISIGEDGFRETAKLGRQKIVAIGDSFTFGWGMEQDRTWVERLERMIGKSVYNLGLQDASPKQELLLLEHLLRTNQLDLQRGLLLWTIFEGNDLEDSFDELRPKTSTKSTLRKAFSSTIVELLWEMPMTLKHESVANRLRTGQIGWASTAASVDEEKRHVVEGVRIPVPLYRSKRFGYKLFHPDQIERAASAQAYVLNHPHVAPLRDTFTAMSALAARYDFNVIVVVAPTDVRLYGPYFEGFPTLSAAPHFNMLVKELARLAGFEVIDLQSAMQPYAGEELLYFRDDDHWNERGHEVVAKIVAKDLGSLTDRFERPERRDGRG